MADNSTRRESAPIRAKKKLFDDRSSLLAAACVLTGSFYDGAAAAPAGPETLSPVTIDTPAEKKKPAAQRGGRGQRTRNATRAPARSAPATAVAAPVGANTTPGRAVDANPYADPSAPYKVNRTSSSKFTETIANTPRTIIAIPKEVIDDKQATSLRELVRTTPGLTLGSGEGGNAFGDRIFIRGFDARNDIYRDGLRDPGVTTRENFDTEQVEILKGPSTTIGGRGTAGGALNIVSKLPLPNTFYKATTTFGTDATKRVTLDVNQVVTPDVTVRANGMWQHANVAERDFVRDNRWGGAFAMTWKPLENFSNTVDYYHVDFSGRGDWGVPYNATARAPWTDLGVRRQNWYGIRDRDFQRNRANIISNVTNYKYNEMFSFINRFRYGETLTSYIAGLPGSTSTAGLVSVGTQSRYQTNAILVDQPEMTVRFDTLALNHTFVVGGEVSRELVSRDSYTGLTVECFPTCTGGTQLDLYNPYSRTVNLTSVPTVTGRPTIVKVDTAAGYALDTIKWQNFILSAGVRVDDYNISSASIDASGNRSRLANHSLMANWNAGLVYKLLPTASLYVSAATSSNPVGAELDAGAVDYGGLGNAANAILGPEQNTGLELGSKWEFFDSHLLMTASLFQTTKDNARETVGSTVLASAGYRVRGFEYEVTGKVTDKLSVFGGAVLMDSEVTKSNTASNVGLQLANIAHKSFSLMAKYEILPGLDIGGQVTWRNQIFGGTLAANQNVLPSFWRFDLLAEYEYSKNIEFRLNILNLTNKLYYDAFYRSNQPFTYVAPGRAAYLTGIVKF